MCVSTRRTHHRVSKMVQRPLRFDTDQIRTPSKRVSKTDGYKTVTRRSTCRPKQPGHAHHHIRSDCASSACGSSQRSIKKHNRLLITVPATTNPRSLHSTLPTFPPNDHRHELTLEEQRPPRAAAGASATSTIVDIRASDDAKGNRLMI